MRAGKSTDTDTDADEEEATATAPALDAKAVVKDKSGFKMQKPDSDGETNSEGSSETDEKAISAPMSGVQKRGIQSLRSAPSGDNGYRTQLPDAQNTNSCPDNGVEPQKPTLSGDAGATGARAPATIDANPMQQLLHTLLD